MEQTNTLSTQNSAIKLDPSWLNVMGDEFQKSHMIELKNFLRDEKKKGKVIFPPGKEIFAALDFCPFDQVKVVILGQDPYHGLGEAHGLCFSVRGGTRFPPSLQNIFKELQSDLNLKAPGRGDLSHWAKQGVLLLNATLTVEKDRAGSHQGRGWELFTDRIVKELNEKKENLVFILWGSYAQKKGAIIDTKKHFVLKCVHPSPLSAHRGFFGSKPFSKTNEYLKSKGIAPIDWCSPTN